MNSNLEINIDRFESICKYIDNIPNDIQYNIFKYINLENNLNIIRKQKILKDVLINEFKRKINLKNKIISYYLISSLSYIDDYLEYSYLLNNINNTNVGNTILNSYNNINNYYNNISNIHTPLSYYNLISYYNSINNFNTSNTSNTSNMHIPIISTQIIANITSNIYNNISVNNDIDTDSDSDDIYNINIIIDTIYTSNNSNLFSNFTFPNNNNWNNWDDID